MIGFDYEISTSLALLYNYSARREDMLISRDTLKEYHRVIEENLKVVDSKIGHIRSSDFPESIYFNSLDENGKLYSILKPDIDTEKAMYDYYSLPLPLIIASQEENALDVLGLTLVDGKIVKKEREEHKVRSL